MAHSDWWMGDDVKVTHRHTHGSDCGRIRAERAPQMYLGMIFGLGQSVLTACLGVLGAFDTSALARFFGFWAKSCHRSRSERFGCRAVVNRSLYFAQKGDHFDTETTSQGGILLAN